ncbi:OVALX protein, partial [Burhinus bistriatus]|nr:OVALX protein [Burhinus bistriatus]
QIQDFLEPGSIDLDTMLVLVNAIYFKGIWKTAFKAEDTREFPFSVTKVWGHRNTFWPGSQAVGLHSQQSGCYTYKCCGHWPGDLAGPLTLENKISFEKLTEWTSPNVMEKKRVKVYLPRMKIEGKYNLTSVLMALGMTDLFSPSANLSGISSAESLKISEAMHEAYMEVNEEGTEMAGSAGVMGFIKHSSEFEEFRADHPFLFLIKHNPTNSILFFGRYCSP